MTAATWNPIDKSVNVTLSGGDLDASCVSRGAVRSTLGIAAGIKYAEITLVSAGFPGAESYVGCVTATVSLDMNALPPAANRGGVYYSNGAAHLLFWNAASVVYGANYITGDVISVLYDATTGFVTFYKNGVSQTAVVAVPPGTLLYLLGGGTDDRLLRLNVGATPFVYALPPGASGWDVSGPAALSSTFFDTL